MLRFSLSGTLRNALRMILPASPPPLPHSEPYKTHLAYVKERRSANDGAAILAEALERLRQGGPAIG